MTLQLDFRVTTLEENSGGEGNSSINELELRVETLENTSTDHEIRLTASEANIEGMTRRALNSQWCITVFILIVRKRSFATFSTETSG